MSIPLFVPPGEGPIVQIRDTKRTTFKLTSADTDDQFGLFEHRMAPFASGARTHVHRKTTEMFYVVRGEIEFVIGDRKEVGKPGAFAFIPRDAPHGFTNVGSEEALMLIMFYPLNKREEYFRGLQELTRDGRDPSMEELVELMGRYDQYLV